MSFSNNHAFSVVIVNSILIKLFWAKQKSLGKNKIQENQFFLVEMKDSNPVTKWRIKKVKLSKFYFLLYRYR